MSEAGLRTALVTGASGAIGLQLCGRLSATGWRVIGLSSREPADGPWHRYLTADLSDAAAEAVADRLAGESVTVVWHLAAKAHALGEIRQDSTEYDRINAGGTRTALALARRLGAKRFVLASSVKAMGEGSVAVLDESAPCTPATPYGRSKLDAEKLVLAAGSELEPVVLRFCMVYGAGVRGNMVRMLDSVRRGRFPPFPETGNRRSFVHVDDAVQACILAGVHPAAPNEIFIVTDGRVYSTSQLYIAMRAALELGPAWFTPPLGLFGALAKAGDLLGAVLGRRAPLDSDTLAKLTESAVYSPAKIQKLLGYVPAWSLERGLGQMVARLREEGGAS